MNKGKRGTVISEPIALTEARNFLRLDTFGSPPTHPEDELIETMITASRSWCEKYLNHSIAYSEYTAYFNNFEKPYLNLHDWPITSVNSVNYLDSNGDTQTLSASNYILDNASLPARLYLTGSLPSVKDQVNAITVAYQSGYTDTISPNEYPTPKEIKHAILLMLAHFYENRQQVGQKLEVLPYGVEWLLQPHRINLGV